jgi:hypothetical protein
VNIEAPCSVAVRQSGVPGEMSSQSIVPVTAVGTVATSPTTSASHHAFAAFSSDTPSAERTPRIAASV